jgi:hypothetical protein
MCGGFQYQHIRYDAQFNSAADFKRTTERIGHLDAVGESKLPL